MNDYAERKRIPLEHATNEELIAAIEKLTIFGQRKEAEKAIYFLRVDRLLEAMQRICDKIDEMRARPDASEHAQVVKRMKLHHRFTQLNSKLAKLQGD